jgi:hypothetical protein
MTKNNHTQELKTIAINNIVIGMLLYLGFVFLMLKHSDSFARSYLSGQILFVFLIIFALFASCWASINLNKGKVLYFEHPVFQFFKILFSKSCLLPSLFLPIGALIGHLIYMILLHRTDNLGAFKAGIFLVVLLYFAGLVGSFIGLAILNKR